MAPESCGGASESWNEPRGDFGNCRRTIGQGGRTSASPHSPIMTSTDTHPRVATRVLGASKQVGFCSFLLRDAGFGFHMLSLVAVRARRRAHDHDRIEKCRERLMHDLLCRRGQPVKETPSMGKWKLRRSYSGVEAHSGQHVIVDSVRFCRTEFKRGMDRGEDKTILTRSLDSFSSSLFPLSIVYL
jgi:hypothetical protein